MLNKEKEFYSTSCKLIVGVDEAGRGPLAGPVFAAAALFAPDFADELIDDSKKLTSLMALLPSVRMRLISTTSMRPQRSA